MRPRFATFIALPCCSGSAKGNIAVRTIAAYYFHAALYRLRLTIAISVSVASLPVISSAHGCIKGAAVGGVAGHHAVAGAAVGCVIGHHHEKVKEREAAAAQSQIHERNTPITQYFSFVRCSRIAYRYA